MITIETVCLRISGLERDELERWIGEEWIRPEGAPGAWRFREIDIARARLIRELRHDLQLHEEALPVVLSLLDQLYAERRRLRRLRDVLERETPAERRASLLAALDFPAVSGRDPEAP